MPPTAADLNTALIVAAVVLSYRLAISPTVRAVARHPTSLTLLAALLPAALIAFLPSPDPGSIRWFAAFVIALLTWQGATSDYDVTEPVGPQRLDKLLLLALGAAACFWPPVLLAWMGVYCGRLRGWKHHAMMPLRLLKAYLAWFLVTALFETSSSATALVLVLGCVSLSHYVKPAWSKARLGPRPWSWAWHNRTHYLMASAYSWGWARFLRPETVSGVLRRTRGFDRPLNLLTMATEAVGLIAFLDPRLLLATLAATALFGLAVALASGILFWENICANTALAVTIAFLPSAEYDQAFGWPAALIAVVVIVLSVADLLWQPWHLGWWDSPFTARIHWQVETTTGTKMGLYNDFMCPYEREYGRVLGYFLTSEPILHGHLGIVWDRTLRDLIVQANGDKTTLAHLKKTYGQVEKDERQANEHLTFLTTMFSRLNDGARKAPLPRVLRRLKAPGGQLYRWGDLPPYRGSEPVRRITIRYAERCYRPLTGDFVLVTDDLVHTIDLIPPKPDHGST